MKTVHLYNRAEYISNEKHRKEAKEKQLKKKSNVTSTNKMLLTTVNDYAEVVEYVTLKKGVEIKYDGTISLQNPTLQNRKRIINSGFKGEFSLKRSTRKIFSFLNIFAKYVSKQETYSYFITMTFSDDYTDDKRQEQRKRYLKKIQKQGVFFWITEKTKRGKFHFHIILISPNLLYAFEKKKNPKYAPYAELKGLQKWSHIKDSLRYCGSKNGLDVSSFDQKAIWYVSKYVGKKESNIVSKDRVWGCTRLGKYHIPNDHVESFVKSGLVVSPVVEAENPYKTTGYRHIDNGPFVYSMSKIMRKVKVTHNPKKYVCKLVLPNT